MKKIVFSNRKGGTGKSTLCIQFANYLIGIGKMVAVFDADPQQSIVNLRNREVATNPDAELPWRVWNTSENTTEFLQKVQQMGDGYVLIDLPGTINKNLLETCKQADAIVVPFRYDDLMVDSTLSFVKVLKKAGLTAPILFLPNCIDLRVRYANEEPIKDLLRKVGTILPRIKQGVAIQRVSTLKPIDSYQQNAVHYTIDELLAVLDKSSNSVNLTTSTNIAK